MARVSAAILPKPQHFLIGSAFKDERVTKTAVGGYVGGIHEGGSGHTKQG